MTKHTPGPWQLEAGRSFVTQSGRFHLSYGSDPYGKPNFPDFCELDANARLIAASPDLLAALEDLERLGADDGRYQKGSPLAKAWSAARSAIRKAREES